MKHRPLTFNLPLLCRSWTSPSWWRPTSAWSSRSATATVSRSAATAASAVPGELRPRNLRTLSPERRRGSGVAARPRRSGGSSSYIRHVGLTLWMLETNHNALNVNSSNDYVFLALFHSKTSNIHTWRNRNKVSDHLKVAGGRISCVWGQLC